MLRENRKKADKLQKTRKMGKLKGEKTSKE